MQHTFPPEAGPLGNPVAEFRRSRFGLTLLMLLLVGFFIFSAWWNWRQTPADITGVMIFSGLTLCLSGLFFYGLQRIVFRVLLFEQGMLAYRMRGMEVVRWDAIEQVQIDLSTVHGITALGIRIRRQDGQTIRISGTPGESPRSAPTPGLMPRIGLPDLVGIIAEASHPHRLANAIARYEAGARVDFKTVQVSRDGLHVKGRTLPWSRVSDIDTDEVIMLVREVGRARPWGVVRVIQIPNEDVLPALIAQTQGAHYTAFQERGESREVAAIQQERRRRHRLLRWGLPLLIIGLPLAINYGHDLTTGEADRWRGEKAFYRGDYMEALDAFDLALQRDPNNPLYFVNRGRAERELGLDVRALNDFATALRMQPGYPYALLNRGRLYYQQGDYDQAIADYTQAIAHRANYDSAYCSRGLSYAKLGVKEQAVADFTTCYNATQDRGLRDLATRQLEKLRAGP